MKKFKSYLNESKMMLDISIKDASKVFTTNDQISKFLDEDVTIFEKYDGVKVTLIRNSMPFSTDYRKNWIVGYKGSVIYPEEFSGIKSNKEISKNSIGTSQFKFVHDLLKRVHHNTKSIPKNTEFFIEYLMNKPTLTRDYKFKHGLVLIGYGKTKYQLKNGILKSNPVSFLTKDREKFAKKLGVNTPKIIYKGKLRNYIQENVDDISLFEHIKSKLLSIESEFGGMSEGVVIQTKNGYYKFIQNDQHDKNVRLQKKLQYRMSKEEELVYWNSIRTFVQPIVFNLLDVKLQDAIKKLSKLIYSESPTINHDKKTKIQIQDDMFLTAKQMLIKNQKGNNGAIFIGRFSPPSKAHISIIEKAFKEYDSVTVNIVKSGKISDQNPFPLDLQKQILKSVFPNLIIQTSKTANISTIINKSENNINVILAGSDRVDSYRKMLARNPDISVVEIKRSNDDISATKIREALKNDDIEKFKKNTDKRTWQFYEELKRYVK